MAGLGSACLRHPVVRAGGGDRVAARAASGRRAGAAAAWRHIGIFLQVTQCFKLTYRSQPLSVASIVYTNFPPLSMASMVYVQIMLIITPMIVL